MSLEELKEKSVDDLRNELLVLRQNQLKLNIQKATGQLKNSHQIREVKRNIARVKTLLRQNNVRV